MFAGVTIKTIRDNSRIVEINDRRNPEINPLFVSGYIILLNLVQNPAPNIDAASSRDLSICIIAEDPVLEEKGILLASETRTRRVNVPYSDGSGSDPL